MVYYISGSSATTPMGQIREVTPKSDTTKAVELATKTQVETVKPCNDAVKLETSAKSSVETKSIDFVDNKKEVKGWTQSEKAFGSLTTIFAGVALAVASKTGGQCALAIGGTILGLGFFNSRPTKQ